MTHFTSDELIDAMEDRVPSDRRTHLDVCDECRRQLDDLAAVLDEAREAGVPEPSPLFWNHFSARVRTAIDTDTSSHSAWPAWLRWQTLTPIGAVALLLVALATSVPEQDPAGNLTAGGLTAPGLLKAPPADNWDALADLVGELDIETASAAGVIGPGFADQAVLELTADERVELTRLLQAELARVKS